MDIIIEKRNTNSLGETYFETIKDIDWKIKAKEIMQWFIEQIAISKRGMGGYCTIPEEFVENTKAVLEKITSQGEIK